FLNGAAERLLGVDARGAVGRPFGEVAGLGDEVLESALGRGEVFAPPGYVELAGPGATTPVEVVASPIRGHGERAVPGAVAGLPAGWAAGRAGAELGEAREAAEAANLAKDRFPAALGHELRTPLTSALLGISYMLEGDEAPAALRPTFEMIRRN